MKRCQWVPADDPLYIEYHDREWGVPVHDDRKLFEMLVLEGAQAGLSWKTVLRKRENYRRAFHNFDFRAVAQYGDEKLESLGNDPGIIRNRLKIRSAVSNARAFLRVVEEFGSFDSYIWGFTGGVPIDGKRGSTDEVPAETDISRKMSRDLRKRGFRFVGPTICYSFMQAVGMVNDHVAGCFRRDEILRMHAP